VHLKIKGVSHSAQFVANLYWLGQIRPNHLALVGFKAFYLGHLLQRGCSVVPGFVVSTQVLRHFLEKISWSAPLFADLPGSALHLNIDNPYQLQAIAQELRQAIATALLSEEILAELEEFMRQMASPMLILRPSLVVESHQPKLQPALREIVSNSSGLLTSKVVAANLEAVTIGLKQVWENLFNAKSLYYWQRLAIPLHRVRLAVLIQSIQPAIAAGTLRIDNGHLELGATPGLGMAIARGEVFPDVYQLNIANGQLLSQQLGQRSLAYHISEVGLESYWLDDAQRSTYSLPQAALPAFAQLMQSARAAMGMPVDLEWVLYPSLDGPAIPTVTQVVPKVTTSLLPSASVAPPPVPAKKNVELFPGASLIATGLAASAGQAIAQASVIHDVTLLPSEIPPHTVLVAPTIPLNWVPHLQQAAAFVSEHGSLTSHSAIVAREIGVPAVVGIPHITQQIQPGELLWVDGDHGQVYRFEKSESALQQLPTFPARREHQAVLELTPYPLDTQLLVNLSQPDRLAEIAALPINGLGLLRAEILSLSILEGQTPLAWLEHHSPQAWIDQMAAAIAQFAKAFHPRPVFYRSFDWRSNELVQPGQTSSSSGGYPVLGLRGTFSYRIDNRLFMLELQALRAVQQMGYTNLRLLLPFVRTVEEFQFCQQWVQEMGLAKFPDFQLWIMAEVPSVLLLLPDYVEVGVQGISIGTNDLTQLLLGVDRDDALMSTAFEERHPAVQRAIAQLIKEARSLNIPCAICGEAPVLYPEIITDLVHWGIHSISVVPEAIETTYQAILNAEQAR